mmetsp:Transcript_5884/g.9088  ORF Transcript_5884/g.9088 Transcript_5884/m.9088 type:complete len:422 (+) Transcript_5884:48-1313(+)
MADASTLGDEHSIAQSFALPRLPRVANAGEELEQICKKEFEASISDMEKSLFPGFPLKCLPIVKLFAGNHCCVDCGDQSPDALEFGSVGYGTLLCKDCACRHTINTQDLSDIKSLTNDHWDLHSILSLFEGGNTKMLEYIKDKPRWRPKKKTGDSEDVISFKQIYLSKASTAYRTNLANKVELLYQSRMEALRKETIQREQKTIRRNIRNRNPFINVFEMNDVNPKDIPGFNNSANIGFRKYAARPKAEVKKEEEPAAASYTSDPAQLDLIKERITLRRSMGPSTANEFTRRLTNSSVAHSNSRPSLSELQSPYFAQAQSGRRRSSDLLVGEVGDHLIQGQDDYATQFANDGSEDYRNTDKPKIREFWLHNQEEQAPRLAARGTLGTYRRLSAVERRGTIDSSKSGPSDPQRPQFRPPPID